MKRFLSILLAVVMVMSLAVPAFASRFSDIEDSDYANAIEHLTGLGVISGYEDGTFKPEKLVTRAEMAKMLVVCLGLEAGASLLEGTSEFDDVPVTHWATGYIAVAVQYGLIKGDGDGNFRPDDTVTYAEAITMILRALGYNRVVDKTGEWPTNYINKANELGLFEDVEAFKGTDSAARGPITQMMWNMMRTSMWEVGSESEGDGLTYGQGDTMMTVKYPKYHFIEDGKYRGYSLETIKDQLEVEIRLEHEVPLYDSNDEFLTYVNVVSRFVYNENDFYKLVKGTEVEALVFEGKDTMEVVTLFIKDDNVLIEGRVSDLYDEYDNMRGYGTYAYLLLDSNKTSANLISGMRLNGNEGAFTVQQIEKTSRGFSITGGDNNYEYNIDEEDIDSTMVLINGERATLEDVKMGDVVLLSYSCGKGCMDDHYACEDDDIVWIVTRDLYVDGAFTKYVEEDYNGTCVFKMTIGGKEYFAGYHTTFVVPNDWDEDDDIEFTTFQYLPDDGYDFEDFKDQECRAYLDAVGEVQHVEFGEVTEETANGGFYIVASDVWMVSDEDGAEYKIKLTDMNGETKTHTFAEDTFPLTGEDLLSINKNKNSVMWVEFDDEEIKYCAGIIAFANSNANPNMIVESGLDEPFFLFDGAMTDGYDEDNIPNDKDDIYNIFTAIDSYEEETYLHALKWDDTNRNHKMDDDMDMDEDELRAKLTSESKLVKVITDNEDPEDITYTVEVETGKDAFKGIMGPVMIIYSGEFDMVKYAFVWDDNSTSDLMYGLVTSIEADAVNEEVTVILEDEKGNEKEFVLDEESEERADEGTIIIYKLNSKDEIVVASKIEPNDFYDADEVESVDTDKRTAKVGGRVIDLDDESYKDRKDFDKDTMLVMGKVGLDKNDNYEFTEFDLVSYDDYKFVEKDFFDDGRAMENFIPVFRLTSASYNEYTSIPRD